MASTSTSTLEYDEILGLDADDLEEGKCRPARDSRPSNRPRKRSLRLTEEDKD